MWELDDEMREVYADRIRVRADLYRRRKELADEAARRTRGQVWESITDDLYTEIRQARRAGMSVIELARASGMTRVTIYRMLEQKGTANGEG